MSTHRTSDDAGSGANLRPSAHEAKSLNALIQEINSEAGTFGGALGTPADRPSSEAEERARSRLIQHVSFRLDDLVFGLPLRVAVEISHMLDPMGLPNIPDWVLGVANLRGEILSLVDLKRFFQLPASRSRPGHHVIIIQDGEMKTGLVVDRIQGMFSVDPEALCHSKDAFRYEAVGRYLANTFVSGGTVIHILDGAKLFAGLRFV